MVMKTWLLKSFSPVKSLLQKPNLETAESYTEERVFWTAGDLLRHFFCCGCIHLIDWQLPLMEEFVAGTICVNDGLKNSRRNIHILPDLFNFRKL